MKLERSKNTKRNIKAGLISKIVSLLCPFAVRTVLIKMLGAEFLGVNSLFSSILSVLSLTELGFGSAIVFNMYKAIAEDDDETINALLYFYKKVYLCIGCIILMLGVALIPFLDYLISGSYPDGIKPVIVYLIYLINTVISYFMYAYLSSLLNAFQRDDVLSVIGTFVNIATYTVQIIILMCLKNYYLYLSVSLVSTVLTNVVQAYATRKLFPKYKPKGRISGETKADIREKVGGLVINKLCGVSRNAFDSIFISMFLGLTQIAIYNNYYYIMNSITAFMSILTSAMVAGVGNSVASETKEKNHQDLTRLNFIYMWIAGWCAVCLLCLFQNFMKLWVGDGLILPMSSMVLFCLYFYVLKMGDIRYVYDQAVGIWWQNRYRAVAEAVTNIILNYMLGKYFGINGIISATLISLFVINFCYGSQIIFKYYFSEQNIKNYYLTHGVYFFVSVAIGAITYWICSFTADTLIGFVIKIVVCISVPNILYLIVYRRTKIYRDSVGWMLSRLRIGNIEIVRKVMGIWN
jgi:O-antigen/teichoic acid export membrane protein